MIEPMRSLQFLGFIISTTDGKVTMYHTFVLAKHANAMREWVIRRIWKIQTRANDAHTRHQWNDMWRAEHVPKHKTG